MQRPTVVTVAVARPRNLISARRVGGLARVSRACRSGCRTARLRPRELPPRYHFLRDVHGSRRLPTTDDADDREYIYISQLPAANSIGYLSPPPSPLRVIKSRRMIARWDSCVKSARRIRLQRASREYKSRFPSEPANRSRVIRYRVCISARARVLVTCPEVFKRRQNYV